MFASMFESVRSWCHAGLSSVLGVKRNFTGLIKSESVLEIPHVNNHLNK